jgi:hypothetical protein
VAGGAFVVAGSLFTAHQVGGHVLHWLRG